MLKRRLQVNDFDKVSTLYNFVRKFAKFEDGTKLKMIIEIKLLLLIIENIFRN